MDTLPAITLTQPTSPEALATVQELFLEYSNSLGVNLEFQNFKNELTTLPGDYAAPRGAILLAWVDGARVRLGDRPVHVEPLTTAAQGGIEPARIAPKARVY